MLGALGQGLLAEPGKGEGATSGSCVKAATPEQAAANGAAHLAGELAAKGYLLAATPGAEDQPDVGNTADAVVALAAQGDTAQAKKSYAWLEKNAAEWAARSGPAAYAQLILAAHATGADPRDFGGTDLVKQLQAAGPGRPGEDHEGGRERRGGEGRVLPVRRVVVRRRLPGRGHRHRLPDQQPHQEAAAVIRRAAVLFLAALLAV